MGFQAAVDDSSLQVKGVLCVHQEYACPGDLTEWTRELNLKTVGVAEPGILSSTHYHIVGREFYESAYVPGCCPSCDGETYANEMLAWQNKQSTTWPLPTPANE